MSEKTETNRRSFLKLAGSSAAGAVSVLAGSEAANATDAPKNGDAGYSETDHVKKVYELARF